MIAKIYSAIPYGYEGQIVDVEGSTAKSLPSFNIVGMAAKTVSEARERVRSAIANSDLPFPDKKVTINLAPAELLKDGSHLDLPIALAILVLSKQILLDDLSGKLFVGELSLDGFTKPVRGIINIVEAAKNAGFSEIYIPEDNLSQASLVTGIKIIGVSSLSKLLLHLKGLQSLPDSTTTSSIHVKNNPTDSILLEDVYGQELAKRALIIAIAGHHNILLCGPPGAGKTMLAKVAKSLLPPPTREEQISITKIHALYDNACQITLERPFRAPHHTASSVSIIGGGSRITPGEISLAHYGILFLDEMPEYPRHVLEALRQPLEDRQITISRANQRVTYPADFMLIGTMNPCPCGYLNDPDKECSCTPVQIEQYRKRLSGPILDRIDLTINVSKVESSKLFNHNHKVKNTKTDEKTTKSTHQIRKQNVRNNQTDKNLTHQQALQAIIAARELQNKRYQRPGFYNSNLSPRDISNYVKITETGEALLKQATEKLELSARAYFRLLRVAQTIADLSHSDIITIEHISEALSYRQNIY